jgi:hypothetical protein
MGRIFWQFIGILSLVGLVGAYFWWIVAAIAAVVAAVLLTRRTIRTAQAQAAELGGTQRRTTRARRSAGTVEPVPRVSFQRARCRLLCGHRHCSESVMVTSMSSVAISPAPQHQLVWRNHPRGAGVLVTSFRVRVWSSAILRWAGTKVNVHATRSLKCPVLA